MRNAALKPHTEENTMDWLEKVRSLGPTFAERAKEFDRKGGFVHENYQDLREHGLFWMGIPRELGGGGASHAEVCLAIREIGRHCCSTGLAFSMHHHPVATNVYKHLRGDAVATRALEKIATEKLVIAGTGANDWLSSSGEAEPVEGGFRVSAHKRFVSGAPGAQLFITSVVLQGEEGPEVLHFAVPFSAEGVQIIEAWDALGMRGTGSHEVKLENVFVSEEDVVARRPGGEWHPLWNVVLPTALPLIVSSYVGMAEAAVDLAKDSARRRGGELASVVGEMKNALTVAQMALDDMIRMNDNHGFTPSVEGADSILTRKALAAEAIKRTVELAAELVGGPGFFKGHPIERIVRDVRAIHYHPLPTRRQQILSGRIALGLDPVGTD